MTKREVATLIRRLTKIKERVGADRDQLREIVDDAESVLETIEEAESNLVRAIDVLSEHV